MRLQEWRGVKIVLQKQGYDTTKWAIVILQFRYFVIRTNQAFPTFITSKRVITQRSDDYE
jgi:hypothetical protein